jgi:hypothetical protein
VLAEASEEDMICLTLLKNKDVDALATALVLSLMRAYPIHPVTPSIISTILWIAGTHVPFNST